MNANKQDAGGLLPCPWCRVSPEERAVPSGGGSYYFAVRCRNWDCPVQPETDEFEAPQGAIAAWNRRNGEQCRAASVPEDIETLLDEVVIAAREDERCNDHGNLQSARRRAHESLQDAKAKLLRALSRGVPEGMVLVPRVPTESMCDAPAERGWAWKNEDEFSADDAESVYRAMIEAAIAAQRKEG